MGTQKCFDQHFADVVAGLVVGLPRLTKEALLASVSNTALLEQRLTQVLCPVWNSIPETLQKQFSHPANLYCTGCMVKKEHCPAYAFDTTRIQFLTFEREGEGPIAGHERISRLLKSRYLPLTTNMYCSLVRRWHHKMLRLLKQPSIQDGTIVFDGLLSSDYTGENTISIATSEEKKKALKNIQNGNIVLDTYMSYSIRKVTMSAFGLLVCSVLYKKQVKTRQYSIVYDPL